MDTITIIMLKLIIEMPKQQKKLKKSRTVEIKKSPKRKNSQGARTIKE